MYLSFDYYLAFPYEIAPLCYTSGTKKETICNIVLSITNRRLMTSLMGLAGLMSGPTGHRLRGPSSRTGQGVSEPDPLFEVTVISCWKVKGPHRDTKQPQRPPKQLERDVKRPHICCVFVVALCLFQSGGLAPVKEKWVS